MVIFLSHVKLPEGKRIVISDYNWYPLVNCSVTIWKDPPFLLGEPTVSMAMFNSYVKLPEGTCGDFVACPGKI